MINSDPPVDDASSLDEQVEAIVAAGPHGAIALAGITTALVVIMWLLFYLLVFVPRGPTP
ncbi:hypothetical protein [Rhizobium mayense]|uniref:Uncharacterized protein n=1 Tax=Rhizobium mayense TaxID=1312184 RepID=A0ABT7JPZ1_9HYPH|nr:hypothetical protein [Rhizobium mayense]MDL2398415.1 hypothetical protein [Rhizobium mayense]